MEAPPAASPVPPGRARPAAAPAARGERAAHEATAGAELSDRIGGLLERLADTAFVSASNPSRDADEIDGLDRPGAAAIRRANLRRYLEERTGASFLLVGEAMGYRGGRFSGMAFTSERQLAAWGAPYAASSTRDGGWTEPSATIIHGALELAGRERDVVLWNAVPAHPHRPDSPLTNRAPTKAEIRLGGSFLDDLIAIVAPSHVVAVGRVAERRLGGLADACVRHPAQGGATACRAGLAAILAE